MDGEGVGALPERLSAPARWALAAAGVTSLDDLAGMREDEVAALHGMGPKVLGQLRDALSARPVLRPGSDRPA